MSIEKAVREILLEIGENPERQGLKDTPDRISRMDGEFYSLCEHHLLPFFGTCHVAYVPNGKIIGLSKIPRVVEMFSRRLQVQERMTIEIADLLNEVLKPDGVAVVAEGYHLCMAMRGIKKAEARMITSAMHGAFKEDERTRMEFLSFIGNHR